MKKEKTEEQNGTVSLAVPEQKTVVLQGDPKQQIEFAKQCATSLMDVIKIKPKKVMINGEQYLEYEDWMTLARFYGATVGTEWTKPVDRDNKIYGYEAKAIVQIKGELVSSAEAMCTRGEKNWANRDEFALRSMAQTRACAKALRNVFAWIVVMAGFKATPVEEMEGVRHDPLPPLGLKTLEERVVKARELLIAAKSIEEVRTIWSTLTADVKLDKGIDMLKVELKTKFGVNE